MSCILNSSVIIDEISWSNHSIWSEDNRIDSSRLSKVQSASGRQDGALLFTLWNCKSRLLLAWPSDTGQVFMLHVARDIDTHMSVLVREWSRPITRCNNTAYKNSVSCDGCTLRLWYFAKAPRKKVMYNTYRTIYSSNSGIYYTISKYEI